MTSGTKVWNIITGLVMIAAGAWLFYDPAHGLKAVAIVLSISCTLRGFQIILYYLTMARHMVSGKAHGFYGVVDILRARESRGVGNPGWKWSAISGITNLLIAAVVLGGGVSIESERVVVYIYAAGLIYTACLRIAGAFRKTDIVYIQ